MKRYSMVVFLLLLATAFQSNAQMHFSVGLKTGINMSTVSFDPDPYQNAQGITKGGTVGLMIGAVAELGFTSMLAVQVEPGYNSNATSWSNTANAK